MRCNPHLSFDGRCRAAFEHYAKHLGGRVSLMMTYGESPLGAQMPDGWGDKIVHGTLELGDHVLTGADVVPEQYRRPQGFSVLLHVDTAAEADRIFASLAENGRIELPIQSTFWAQRFGMLVDRFGVPWMINCGSPPP